MAQLYKLLDGFRIISVQPRNIQVSNPLIRLWRLFIQSSEAD